MQEKQKELRSALSKARGLGATKGGTSHWWLQRVTAVALIPLTIWFVVTIIKMTSSSEEQLLKIIASPFNVIGMVLFLSVGLYHGALGLRVIIEDYVHSYIKKASMLILLQFISILTGLSVVSAIFMLHFSIFNSL